MSDFTLPTNIKQIGSISDGLRIYVEDYVCTFLHQYAESAGYSERLAFLVGRSMEIDGQSVVFINGAIHGKHTEESEGMVRFSEKSIDYAQQMLEEHFHGMEIVGWMQSQPGYGTFLNQNYAAYHVRQFRKPYQVMFVTDPLERANAFFAPNPDAITPAERLTALHGYFIYYDKNTNMHEYMLANKAMDYTAKPPTFVDIQPSMYTEDELDMVEITPRNAGDTAEMPLIGGRHSAYRPPSAAQEEAEETLRRPTAYANQRMRKRGANAPRRPMQLIGSLAAILLVIIFVMGFELVRNQDRIERMEIEISFLTTGYRNLLAELHSGGLTPAFAEQNFAETPTTGETTTGEAPSGIPTGELAAADTPVTTPSPTPPPQAEGDADASIPAGLIPDGRVFPEIPVVYVIQPGDSLLGIAYHFFGDISRVDDIIALNEIANPNHIVAGTTLLLPRR
ncbi:MAG: LysM peptidoglycan-binding domain-containing protein [Defluviitaleaceae bacterium]|nr:LysM peptidoglycan-binding domain-containing protein [Defluviitaleaceae bacterium]MCL2273696.1 LysM peptidoglycan-binding domain-containing protein [Defluviitaleaceae bacterium]